jgi:HEAT repeat protein
LHFAFFTGSARAACAAPALAPPAGYDYGQPLAPLIDYENWLHAATPAERAAAEDELLTLLAAPAATPANATGTTTAARRVFIDWLGVIGTGKSAPALARLAADPDYTFHAARALAAIPGGEAETALLALLGGTGAGAENTRIAAANALGQRRSVAAVHALANHLGASSNADTFSPPGTAFSETADAALLADPDPRLRAAAARALAASSDPAVVEILRDQFPALPPDTRLAALNAIASSRNAAALPVIDAALATGGAGAAGAGEIRRAAGAADSPALREAAIRAAGATGDAKVIPALVAALEDGDPAIAGAAQNALEDFPAETANAPLIEHFGHSLPADAHARLLAILAARQCREALAPALAATAADDPALRAAAFAALARLAGTGDILEILAVAPGIRSASDQREWTRALYAATADSAPDTAARQLASALGAGAGNAKADLQTNATSAGAAALAGPRRAALIGALTLVNAPGASDTLRSLLAAPDPAVRKETIRALSATRDAPAACKLLLETARNAPADDERTLALIGAIATLEKLNLPAAAKVGEYRAAWSLATRDEERQSIIAAVKKIRAPAASAFLKETTPAGK